MWEGRAWSRTVDSGIFTEMDRTQGERSGFHGAGGGEEAVPHPPSPWVGSSFKEPVNYPGHCSEWASGNAITFK